MQVGPVGLQVMAEPLRLGGVIVNVSARTAQAIADILGGLLPTPKIVDEIWERSRWRPKPCILPPDSQMATTERMLRHSRQIDAQLAAMGAGVGQLVANCGKHWTIGNILLRKRGRAQNYGWHDEKAPYKAVSASTPVWQPAGTAHNVDHTDYSQTLQLVAGDCLIGGALMRTDSVLRDSELCQYVSDEGELELTRQPGVPAFTLESVDVDGKTTEEE